MHHTKTCESATSQAYFYSQQTGQLTTCTYH